MCQGYQILLLLVVDEAARVVSWENNNNNTGMLLDQELVDAALGSRQILEGLFFSGMNYTPDGWLWVNLALSLLFPIGHLPRSSPGNQRLLSFYGIPRRLGL